MKLRKGDEVVVLAGKDIGKRGTITHVLPDRDKVIVTSTAGINVVKRHTKPKGATIQGGIIDKEMPIHVSNVALWCTKCGATRIGFRFDDDGKKVRVCRRCGSDT
jgi:large subunit ribosomal protein L24